jgi:hypothetical protein
MMEVGQPVAVNFGHRLARGRIVSERLRERGGYGVYRVAFKNGANEMWADFSEKFLIRLDS